MVDHILFPTDFSDNAEHAFSTVKGLVANGAKHLTLLHAQDNEKASRHLGDAHAGLKDQQRLHQGSVETLADPKMATLVVVGRHGRGEMAGWPIGPTPPQRGARELRGCSRGAAKGGVNDDAGL